MVSPKWNYHKKRSFVSNYFIFLKILRTSYKELIWCANAQMPIFVCLVSVRDLRCFFPVSTNLPQKTACDVTASTVPRNAWRARIWNNTAKQWRTISISHVSFNCAIKWLMVGNLLCQFYNIPASRWLVTWWEMGFLEPSNSAGNPVANCAEWEAKKL